MTNAVKLKTTTHCAFNAKILVANTSVSVTTTTIAFATFAPFLCSHNAINSSRTIFFAIFDFSIFFVNKKNSKTISNDKEFQQENFNIPLAQSIPLGAVVVVAVLVVVATVELVVGGGVVTPEHQRPPSVVKQRVSQN